MSDTAELDAENLEAYEDLLVTIEASEGVLSLLIAVCDNIQFREELIDRVQRLKFQVPSGCLRPGWY